MDGGGRRTLGCQKSRAHLNNLFHARPLVVLSLVDAAFTIS